MQAVCQIAVRQNGLPSQNTLWSVVAVALSKTNKHIIPKPHQRVCACVCVVLLMYNQIFVFLRVPRHLLIVQYKFKSMSQCFIVCAEARASKRERKLRSAARMERKGKEEKKNNSCSQFKKTNCSNKFAPNPRLPPLFSCSELLLWVKLVLPSPLTVQ